MDIKKIATEISIVFAITLLVTLGVTFLWSLVFHGVAIIDWETSFRFAIILGIILTIIDSRKEIKSEK
jgi:hypothetical protein